MMKSNAESRVRDRRVESAYCVVTWLCDRTCEHCHDDLFLAYHGEDLDRMIRQSLENGPGVIADF
jgi:hypothetical protein